MSLTLHSAPPLLKSTDVAECVCVSVQVTFILRSLQPFATTLQSVHTRPAKWEGLALSVHIAVAHKPMLVN